MKRFYGFDLGDAESAVSLLEKNSDIPPTILEIEGNRSFITAYAALSDGTLLIGENACYAKDDRPIEEGCDCPACRHHTRAYIRHLLKAGEMLGLRLLVLHFYNTMMKEAREAIREKRFSSYKNEKLARVEGGAQ